MQLLLSKIHACLQVLFSLSIQHYTRWQLELQPAAEVHELTRGKMMNNSGDNRGSRDEVRVIFIFFYDKETLGFICVIFSATIVATIAA